MRIQWQSEDAERRWSWRLLRYRAVVAVLCMMIGLVASVDAPVLVVALRVGSWAVSRVDARVLETRKSDGRMTACVKDHTKAWRLSRVVWASVVFAGLVRADMLAQAAAISVLVVV
jgi:hypothetical protein